MFSLEVQLFLKKMNEINKKDLECPICLEIFEDPVVVVGCGHIFCSKCIEKCLESKKECPFCKKKTTKDLVEKLDISISNGLKRFKEDGNVLTGLLINSYLNKVRDYKLLKDKEYFKKRASEVESVNEELEIENEELKVKIEKLEFNNEHFKEKNKELEMKIEKIEFEVETINKKNEEFEKLKRIVIYLENVREVLEKENKEVKIEELEIYNKLLKEKTKELEMKIEKIEIIPSCLKKKENNLEDPFRMRIAKICLMDRYLRETQIYRK